jgi:4-amino-4-deoxy-L-arabinose transferase-like glycosyltransferase
MKSTQRTMALGALLAITFAGGALRLANLSSPPIWNDEANTYRRVCGSFHDLVRTLEDDGFVPLHYEIDWLLAQARGGARNLTPPWLRLFPAFCGTLMPPVMYWLARTLRMGRRSALLVAAFAASSAFLVAHSRDAKMYMPLWLACAVHVACLLDWLRARTRLAWWAWLASGVAMVSLHATGLIVLAIEPLMMLAVRPTVRRRAWIAFAAGAVVTISGPLGYYIFSNRWSQRIEAMGWNRGSGLGWIQGQNEARGRLALMRYTASAYLSGWEWPDGGLVGQARDGVPAPVIALFSTALVALSALAALAWVRSTRAGPRRSMVHGRPVAIWLIMPLIAFAIAGPRLWVARYLAVVWPAFAIVLCAGLLRLPWTALRIYAISLLLAVNLANSIAMITARSEPPVDLMIADLVASNESGGRTAAWFAPPDAIAVSYSHGGGTIYNHVGKYYYSITGDRVIDPDTFYRFPLSAIVPIRGGAEPGPISAAARADSKLRRLIVWDQVEAPSPGKPLTERLADDWQLVRDDRFAVRSVFTWARLYTARRREWARLGSVGAGAAAGVVSPVKSAAESGATTTCGRIARIFSASDCCCAKISRFTEEIARSSAR